MSIISSIQMAKKYLPAITIKTDISALDDIFSIAEEELASDILGNELYAKLLTGNEDDKVLLTQCERIVSLSGFLKAIPDLDLVLTQSGFAVHNSEAMAPASSSRVAALVANISERLDTAIDTLIRFLISSKKYEELWKSSSQFDVITSSLITNYTEFKEFAQYSPSNSNIYPSNYSSFKKLYSSLNLALTIEVASYLSRAYIEELIEKVRDNEVLNSDEKYALSLIKYAICSFVLDDSYQSRNLVIKARSYMIKHPTSFPTFIASPESQMLDAMPNDGAIFSML